MRSIARWLAAGAAGLLLSGGALAQDTSPEGVWTTPKEDSRYQFYYCGDGSALCVKLIWLSDAAQKKKPETVAYLNTLQVDQAKQASPTRWKGQIKVLGHTLDGSIELTADGGALIKGCEFLVICADITLKRYVEVSSPS